MLNVVMRCRHGVDIAVVEVDEELALRWTT